MRIVAVQVLLKSVAIVKGLVDCYRRDWSYYGVGSYMHGVLAFVVKMRVRKRKFHRQ